MSREASAEYWYLRAPAAALGLLLLLLALASTLPPFVQDDDEAGVITSPLWLLLAATVLLLPFRWTATGALRHIRSALLGALAGYCSFVAAVGIYGFLGGHKSWHIVPVGAFLAVGSGAGLAAHVAYSKLVAHGLSRFPSGRATRPIRPRTGA